MSDATRGVPRLVSGPRKKPTITLSAKHNVHSVVSLPKKQQRPRAAFSPARRGRDANAAPRA